MPLPATSERAARAVARVLADLDDAVLSFLAGRGRLPSQREILADLRPLVQASVIAALREVDPDVPQSVVDAAVRGQLGDLQTAIAGTLDDARRVKRRLPANPPVQEDDETIAGFVRRVGKYAALGALIAARSRSSRNSAVEAVQSASRSVSVRTPKRTAGYGRMLVRTQTAIDRNTHSADVVEARQTASDGPGGARPGEWAVYIRDAMKGPTDHECESVDRKWATPQWLRNNPVSHPNCTRIGRPRILPQGAVVTLLS